jgi:(E)-4-hydroxy-3-methylbut-2-enyl-diphosphate synthase
LNKYGVTAIALVESALEHVQILEENDFYHTKISVKTSSVKMTIDAYKLLASKVSYPFHIGVTEAGTEFMGTIKSSIGIGSLLSEGIGDTIRVSLTDDPVKEISVARGILKSLNLRKGIEIISCPTCGRTKLPLVQLTNEVEKRLKPFEHLNISVAVMGCEVNGPGEAREADYGIAGGKDEGLIFKKGEIITKLPTEKLIDYLINIITNDNI